MGPGDDRDDDRNGERDDRRERTGAGWEARVQQMLCAVLDAGGTLYTIRADGAYVARTRHGDRVIRTAEEGAARREAVEAEGRARRQTMFEAVEARHKMRKAEMAARARMRRLH